MFERDDAYHAAQARFQQLRSTVPSDSSAAVLLDAMYALFEMTRALIDGSAAHASARQTDRVAAPLAAVLAILEAAHPDIVKRLWPGDGYEHP